MNERGKNMNIIRVLKKSIREYKRDSILTPVLVAFEALVECIIPLMVANLVNRMQNGCDLSVIVKYGVILIIMPVSHSYLGLLQVLLQPMLQLVLVRTYVKTCLLQFRTSHLKTLTVLVHLHL